MKKSILFIILLALVTVSCNSFLDTPPDNRAELDTPKKISDLLVSAYPLSSHILVAESMTDNIDDNGPLQSYILSLQDASFVWGDKGVMEALVGLDSPTELWEANYVAIASANHALEAIAQLGTPSETLPSKGEALLCRAYAHFIQVNFFSRAYNPQTSGTDLGIPYVLVPENVVIKNYPRGTVKEVYELINKDIEEGLPLIKDTYKQPLFHFNVRAAYAFAARFNLFYGNYSKTIEYANKSIGSSPKMRNMSLLTASSNAETQSLQYIDKSESANAMLLPVYSIYGRIYEGNSGKRFVHTPTISANETLQSLGPWSDGGGLLLLTKGIFGDSKLAFFSKLDELFEVTNPQMNTGIPHIVIPAFTTEETLLCRAEAHTMLKAYDKASADLAVWYKSKGASNKVYTTSNIANYYKNLNADQAKYVRKPLKPLFPFELGGTQEDMIHAVLHARRIETLHEGHRWADIKRWGIALTHNWEGIYPVRLAPHDLRTAIQIPSDVQNAGMEKNPR